MLLSMSNMSNENLSININHHININQIRRKPKRSKYSMTPVSIFDIGTNRKHQSDHLMKIIIIYCNPMNEPIMPFKRETMLQANRYDNKTDKISGNDMASAGLRDLPRNIH